MFYQVYCVIDLRSCIKVSEALSRMRSWFYFLVRSGCSGPGRNDTWASMCYNFIYFFFFSYNKNKCDAIPIQEYGVPFTTWQGPREDPIHATCFSSSSSSSGSGWYILWRLSCWMHYHDTGPSYLVHSSTPLFNSNVVPSWSLPHEGQGCLLALSLCCAFFYHSFNS